MNPQAAKIIGAMAKVQEAVKDCDPPEEMLVLQLSLHMVTAAVLEALKSPPEEPHATSEVQSQDADPARV